MRISNRIQNQFLIFWQKIIMQIFFTLDYQGMGLMIFGILEKAGKSLGKDVKDMPEQKGLMAPPQPKEEEMI